MALYRCSINCLLEIVCFNRWWGEAYSCELIFLEMKLTDVAFQLTSTTERTSPVGTTFSLRSHSWDSSSSSGCYRLLFSSDADLSDRRSICARAWAVCSTSSRQSEHFSPLLPTPLPMENTNPFQIPRIECTKIERILIRNLKNKYRLIVTPYKETALKNQYK